MNTLNVNGTEDAHHPGNHETHAHQADHTTADHATADHATTEHVAGDHATAAHATADHETLEADASSLFKNTAVTTVATVGVVGVAAIVFEAALIPGMILGVAAALAPTYVPRLGAALNPLLRSGVRGAYKIGRKTREAVSEAREHMNDIVAEVDAEGMAAPMKAAVHATSTTPSGHAHQPATAVRG